MKKVLIITLFTLLSASIFAQKTVIDGIAAIVGKNVILQSDVESQYLQLRMQGEISGGSAAKCQILENIIIQKLLLNQAELDSLEVSEEQIEANMDQRIRYFVGQMGSEKELEEYYNKSIEEIKDEFREMIREQMLVEKAKNAIASNVNITPSGVKAFYDKIPADSIPLIKTEYVIGQIVQEPPVNAKELNETRGKLKKFRERIIAGERFSTIAILYSQDPGSAKKGGELGFYGRGELYPEFEAVAFNLEKGQVSEIVKTKAGFHLIQLIERRGDLINVRHILLTPKPSISDIAEAKTMLDSIAKEIRSANMTFAEAALKHSDSPDKINGGIMVNPRTNNNKFSADALEPNVMYAVKNMEIGEISSAIPMVTDENKKAYRILFLENKTEPHKANLKQDYNKLQEWAREDKKNKKLRNWTDEKAKKTYIKIMDLYNSCNLEAKWGNEIE
ncbi:MAG: peptidylprolyl isomerase [Bacteroidota bacterium]|nr:peptidylprolyl isomerase [Bacteroidota bacterium]